MFLYIYTTSNKNICYLQYEKPRNVKNLEIEYLFSEKPIKDDKTCIAGYYFWNYSDVSINKGAVIGWFKNKFI